MRLIVWALASGALMISMVVFALIVSTASLPAAHAASPVNSSFEIPALPSGGYQYNPSTTGIGWTFSSNSGIQRNGSAWGAAAAPDGVQTAFIQSTSTISQTLSLSAGSYALTFKAARRSGQIQPIRVTVDGTQIGSLVSPASTSFGTFSISFPVASSGTHTIAFAGTDPVDKTTFIDAVALLPSTTTTLASSLNPASAGTGVTFTATVTGTTPTGNVAFIADGTALTSCGAVALPTGSANSKTATCSTSILVAGTHSVVATYAGDGANSGSTSPALSQVVNPAGSSLVNPSFETPALGSGYQYAPTGAGIGWAFSSSGSGIEHNGSAFNAATAPDGVQTAYLQFIGSISQALSLNAGSYTLSFKAAQRSGQIQPVRVTVDGTQIGSLVSPASTSFATISLSFSVASSGTHTIAFTSTDSADKTTFIDAVTLISSSLASTTTTLASSANPSTAGTSVTFTATVTGGAPAGNIAFIADGTPITGCGTVALPTGSANSKTASCNTASLAAGTRSIVATYAGDAANSSSNSAPFSQVVNTGTRASQTISFLPIPNQVIGTTPPTLVASASSGLPVTFSSMTTAVCTVGGSAMTLVTSGTCTIQASQAGNAMYAPASNVSQTFTVAKANQTITFSALASKTYGVAPFAVSATASSGLPVSFSSLTTSLCTVSGATVTLVAAGTCTIQAAQAGNSSYNAASNVSQSFTISAGARSQTITFATPGNHLVSASPVYLTATASSGLIVSLTSLTTAVCVVSNNYATLLAAGTCTVEASQAGNASYSAAPSVTQGFLVIAVPQFSAATYSVDIFPSSIAIGDFNGDGKPDLAVTNAFAGNVSILLGAANGTLVPGTAISIGGESIAVAAGDFNGDGKLDLAVADLSGNAIVIFAGNGDGTFTRIGTVNAGLAPISIVVADFDGDGKVDLAVANGTGGTPGQTVSVALGNGDGTFRAPVSYVTGGSPYQVVTADFNGDGRPDLAVVNGDPNTVSILLGRGDGTFLPAANYATGWYPDALAVGDFNRDGKLDLAVGNDYSNDVSILLGRGDGTFAAAQSFPAGNGPASVAAADFNQDGWPDLAIANRFDNSLVVLFGNGDGTFQAPLTYLTVGRPKTVVAKDLSGDGKPDIVVASTESNSVWVLLQPPGVPTALSVQSGSPQTAAVGTTYAIPLAVLVKDSGGHPMQGASVTFTVPASGASGSFSGGGTIAAATTDASGVATAPSVTANALTGSFTVTASVGALSASFGLTNTPGATQAPAFANAPPLDWTVSVPYNYALVATGTPAPTFSASPSSLPPGLTLDGITGLLSGTPSARGTYTGSLTASNGVLPNATQSFSITIAGAAQTIRFSLPTNQNFGTQPFTISASASSGLPVAFVSLSQSACAMNGNTVTLLAAGTCTIRASQGGSASYAPAPTVDQSVSVSRGSQTIAFQPVRSTTPLDGAPISLIATASSGLSVSFSSLTPTVCVLDANFVAPIALGTCTIRASQTGNANYNAAPDVEETIAVQQGQQTLTFWSPGARMLGSPPFPLSATASSGLPVTFSSLTPTVCTVNGAYLTTVAVGTCTVKASQPGNALYQAASDVQSFPISSGLPLAPPVAVTGPLIAYSTFLGGDGSDQAFDIVVGPDGSAYVGGSVASTNFPGLSSSTVTNAGLDLLYVAKMNSARGALDFVTVVGGRAGDITDTGDLAYVGQLRDVASQYIGAGQVEAMAIDAAGNVYVAAYAHSINYPVTGGTYSRTGPKSLFKITPSGVLQALGAPIDPAVLTIRALAIDAAGAIYFTGAAAPGLATSASAAIRTMPPPSSPYWTLSAPYLIKLAPGGSSTAFATYLSVPGSRANTGQGSNQSPVDAATTVYALAIDAAGNAYLAGQATCDQFPVTPGSPDSPDTKNRDAFIAKINATGSALVFVARLGGVDAERATSIALSPDGAIVLVGKTATQPFTTFGNSFQPTVVFKSGTTASDRETGFVAKLSADGTRWLAFAAIGSSGGNLVYDIFTAPGPPQPLKVAVDAAGAIYVVGATYDNRTLPIVTNLQGVATRGAFIMKMTPDATRLIYSTTLGDGVATGLALDGFGNAYVTGRADAPLVNGSEPLNTSSVFVAKLNDQIAPISLSSDHNPATAGQVVALKATLADARYGGAIEFDDGNQVIGTAVLTSGVATLPITLTTGIHRLRAVFHGIGPFDGSASVELVQIVDQAAAP